MTMWFNRKPGDFVSPSTEEEGVSLVGDEPPDWVRLPPKLGGTQLKVLSHHKAECPKCKTGTVRHLTLADSYGVAECKDCGFVWYRQGVQ
jgi:hypothetical protein